MAAATAEGEEGQGVAPAACEVLMQELQQLEHTIDGALSAEEVAGSDEPESEETGGEVADEADLGPEEEAAAAEACLQKLQKVIASGVLAPMSEAAADVHPAFKQVPTVIEELTTVLGKTWQLAATRGERRRILARRLAAAELEAHNLRNRAVKAEAAHATAEADAGQGEKAHELLESTLARLTAARKTLKDREWELATVRRRMEDSEEERTRQETRLRNLETALEKAAAGKHEGEKRLSEASNNAATILSDAEELQRRLSMAQSTADKANAGQALAEHQKDELKDQLETSRRQTQELQQQLQHAEAQAQEAAAAATASARGASSARPTAAEHRRRASTEGAPRGAGAGEDGASSGASEDEDDEGEAGPGARADRRGPAAPAAAPIRPGDSRLRVNGLAGLRGPAPAVPEPAEETYVEGVGILAPTPRRALRSSLNSRGGAPKATTSATGATGSKMARLMSPARIERREAPQAGGGAALNGRAPGQKVRRSTGGISEAQPPSMPMDLRALGKMLTGGVKVGKGAK